VHTALGRFVLRRAAFAVLLVFLVSSASLVLAHLAPSDDAFGTDRAVLAAERHRLGLDRPLPQQYAEWLIRSVHFDFGESLRFRRPVTALIRERAFNTILLGTAALAVATLVGIPLGVFTASRPAGILSAGARAASIILLSVPPLVTSLVLLVLAARTGWLPAGGLPHVPSGTGWFGATAITLRYLVLPALALAAPIAASLERLQSRALSEALAEPCILAAIARGVPRRIVIWKHALRMALRPVLAIYGIAVGSVLSGSFVVEIVMSWQGLGDLMYQALQARDLYLVAGCAAAGSSCLGAGILLSDVALAAIDPRIEDLV
jgi:ABC-type dipeptide/oligopeptide/nickel transport system permease component